MENKAEEKCGPHCNGMCQSVPTVMKPTISLHRALEFAAANLNEQIGKTTDLMERFMLFESRDMLYIILKETDEED